MTQMQDTQQNQSTSSSRNQSEITKLASEIYDGPNTPNSQKINDLSNHIAQALGVSPEDVKLDLRSVGGEKHLAGVVSSPNQDGTKTFVTFSIDRDIPNSIFIGREANSTAFVSNNLERGCYIPIEGSKDWFKIITNSMAQSVDSRDVPITINQNQQGKQVLMGSSSVDLFQLPEGVNRRNLSASDLSKLSVASLSDGELSSNQLTSALRYRQPPKGIVVFEGSAEGVSFIVMDNASNIKKVQNSRNYTRSDDTQQEGPPEEINKSGGGNSERP